MSLSRLDFDAISEVDLAELVTGQVPEGLHLDYKGDTYGSNDSYKKELLKDVSAFANANGGHIVIGMDETEAVASDLCGIRTADIDAELRRLDQIIRTGVEPRIPVCRLRAIPLATGAQAIVIRISRSWRLPHRICAQNNNRFWIRNSAGSHEASMDELRHLFTSASSAVDRARAFRDERIELFQQGRGPRPLAGNGRFIFHIYPLSAAVSAVTVDVEEIYAHQAAFEALGSMGISSRYNLEGVVNERGREINRGYTQVFRNGIVEATISNLIQEYRGRDCIPGLHLLGQFFHSLPGYINGLKALGVEPPLILMLTLDGVEGIPCVVSTDRFADAPPPFDRETVRLPECLIEEYSVDVADYHQAIRPAVDALWNVAGYSKSRCFDENTGLWKND